MNPGVSADIVRTLGRIQHTASHFDRLSIAERLLQSDSPLARDASGVALEKLGYPHAVPVLRDAVATEPIPELRSDLAQILDELEATADGIHPAEA